VLGLFLSVGLLSGCDGDQGPDPSQTEDLRGPVAIDRSLRIAGTRLGELAGSAVAGDFDLNGDGQADVAVGAMLGDNKHDGGGRACVFLGRLKHDLTLPESLVCLHGQAENHLFGRDVEGLGDLNGDGFDELGIGAVHHDEGGANSGMVSVVWGEADPSEPAQTEVYGTDPGGHVGLRFTRLPGDLPRFAVGGHETILDAEDADELRGEGVVWIVSEPPSERKVPISDVALRWTGEREDDRLGVTVASPGDVDGDGLADLLVGASQARRSDDGPQVGAVYLLLSPFEAGGSASDADGVVFGEHDLAWFGWAVAGLEDIDGDGLADFAASAFKDGANGPDAGAVYVFSGAPAPDTDPSMAIATLLGEWEGDKAGEVLEPGGDLDGDGRAELLVGAPTASHRRTWGGAVYAVRGPFEGLRSLGDQDALWVGVQDLQFTGSSLARAGDVAGTPDPDLIVGAMGDTTSTGAAFLLTQVLW